MHLILLHGYLLQGTGSNIYVANIAKAWQGQGHAVTVVCQDYEAKSLTFVDHYIDYPFDLSQVFFITTANNTTTISTAVMDRLEPISMPSYNDDEKIHIGRDYLLPDAMQEAGISKEQLQIDDTLWPKVVRPLGFDAGIRTLQRTIQGITRKVAKQIVEGKAQSVHLTAENINEYLPKD